MDQHREIARVVITTFGSHAEASDHERRLIRTLNPIHNVERYLQETR